ncbi:MAG: amidohydrolase family protein [Candidatus Latescibacteria bacterium]|nr:amidohydrolase family protein [Candidatus Latescibacterota bacterium]
MRIVDTHAHVYHSDEGAYPMIAKPFRPPAGSGTIEHLRREARNNGVAGAVLIQTGSAYKWDNRLIADLAAANPDWTVGVCNLDPAGATSPAELARLVEESNVRGLRLESIAGGPFYHRGAVDLFATAQRLGAVVCAHGHRAILPDLARLLKEFPQVPVVLDHCAYPEVAADGVGDATVQEVCKLDGFPQLYMKLTFGVTKSERAYPFADTHAALRHFIQVFGPQRCMWGSDFPCDHWLKTATYAQHLALFQEELGLSRGEQEAILGETPWRLWFAERKMAR